MMKRGSFNPPSKKSGFRSKPNRSKPERTLGAASSQFNLTDPLVLQAMNDRFNYLLIKSIGSQAIATVGSGLRYKGVVSVADSSNGNLSVVLSNPEHVDNVLGQSSGEQELPKELIIQSRDLMDLQLFEVDLVPVSKQKAPSGGNAEVEAIVGGFKTDTDISGNLQVKERDLQKWTPEGDDLVLEGLEDSSSHGAWDQFEVNEKKFGVQSSWDENLYTTRLDKSAPDYLIRLKEAEKIAKEIEKEGHNGNVHLAEERGIAIDDSGMDEEDKYSGVDRRGDRRGNELMAALRSGVSSGKSSAVNVDEQLPSNKNGKYITPKQRNEVHNLDPAIISSTRQKAENEMEKSKPTKNKTISRQEINSLKEFSANFKIPQKFPSDLLPILSNDKQKQEEIIKKNSKKVELPPKPSPKVHSDEIKKEHTGPVSKDAKRSPEAPKKKMDPRAPAFKLNPAAASFTPSSSTSPLKSFNKVNSPAKQTHNLYGNNRHKRNYTPQQFFNKVPKADHSRKTLNDDLFNFPLQSGEVIERSYQTSPTWGSTIEESHKSLFPSEVQGGAGAPRFYNGMGSGFNPVMPGMVPMLPPDPMMAQLGNYPYGVPPVQFNASGGTGGMPWNGGMPPMMPMDPRAMAFGSPKGFQNQGFIPNNGYYSPNMRNNNMSPQANYGKFN